ncbi:MAG: hypothetical protein AAGC79_05015 [Pseudomonadota bacterium]
MIGKVFTTASFICWASFATAVTIHDETVDGDLSNDPNAPTSLAFGVGDNTVIGDVSVDADYITFEILSGQALDAIRLVSFTTNQLDNAGVAFGLLDDGATSVVPSGTTINDFLGGALFGAADVGTDLLTPFSSASAGGTGFARPVGPGTYTFLIQETAATEDQYQLTFVVSGSATAIPLPPAGLALLAGLAGFAALRRRPGGDASAAPRTEPTKL